MVVSPKKPDYSKIAAPTHLIKATVITIFVHHQGDKKHNPPWLLPSHTLLLKLF